MSARTHYYYEVSRFSETMLGNELVLGISISDGSPKVLATREQRDVLRLGNVRQTHAGSYSSLSPILISDATELHDLIYGTQKNKKRRQWKKWEDGLDEWSSFEHSRTLVSVLRDKDPEKFSVESSLLLKTRIFGFSVGFSKLPGHRNLVIDVGYSELELETVVSKPPTRYILRPSLSSPADNRDLAGESSKISENELPKKIQSLLDQSSEYRPFLFIVYGPETIAYIRKTFPDILVMEGIRPLLYPSRYTEFDTQDPRRRSASPQRRQPEASSSNSTHFDPTRPAQRSAARVYIIDVQDMARSATKLHIECPSVFDDAVRFGVNDAVKHRANAAADSRLMIELWLCIGGKNHLWAQREASTLGVPTTAPAAPSFSDPTSEDPNNDDFFSSVVAPSPPTKSEPEPYEYSDEDY